MNAYKLLIVLFLISAEVGATGYSNNMFVAQRMLKAEKVRFTMPVLNQDGTVARVVPMRSVGEIVRSKEGAHPNKSLVQYLSDWLTGWMTPKGASHSDRAEAVSVESESETGQNKFGCILVKWLVGWFVPLHVLLF